MPLIKGKSEKAFKQNVRTEMHHNKPLKQSLAIAYSMKRKAQHKKAQGGDMCAHGGPAKCNVGCYAEGGSVDSWTKREDNERGINKTTASKGISQAGMVARPSANQEEPDEYYNEHAKRIHKKTLNEMRSMPKPKLMADGGDSGELDSMGFPKEEPKPKKPPSTATTSTSSSNPIGYPQGASLAEGGMMKSKRERAMEAFHRMAEGGEPAYKSGYGSRDQDFQSGVSSQSGQGSIGTSTAGHRIRTGHGTEGAKNVARQNLEELKSMSKPKLMAEGGEMEDINQLGDEDEGAGDMDSIHPMVMRIIMGRAKGYSEGGKVANEESGESTDEPTMAKADGNEFDDLALRDDLEFKDTGANSGDELGDAQENHDRNDIISRIMKSRAKRDRMPSPA